MSHSMVGHSMVLLSYVYKQRAKSNILNSEIDQREEEKYLVSLGNLPLEFTKIEV